MEKYLQHRGPSDWVTAAGLMRTDLEMVTPETGLGDALETFNRYRGERLPVVNDIAECVLLGYISKTDVLLTLAHGLRGGPH